LTGQGDREVDMEAMKAGAQDYLNKNNMNSTSLERSIRYAFERHKRKLKLQYPRFSPSSMFNSPN